MVSADCPEGKICNKKGICIQKDKDSIPLENDINSNKDESTNEGCGSCLINNTPTKKSGFLYLVIFIIILFCRSRRAL
jgi:hypothetical protein